MNSRTRITCILPAFITATLLAACGSEAEDPPPLNLPSTPVLPVPPAPPTPTTPTPPPPATPIGLPERTWYLYSIGILNKYETVSAGQSETGVNDTRSIGGLVYAPEGGDGIADVAAFSSGDGRTYWVDAEAPSGNLNEIETDMFGGESELQQLHRFRKDDEDATLHLTITEANVEVSDFNDPTASPPVCPWIPMGTLDHPSCFDQVSGRVTMAVWVLGDHSQKDLYAGAAQIFGYRGEWVWHVGYLPALQGHFGRYSMELAGRARSIFRYADFFVSASVIQPTDDSRVVTAELVHPVVLDLDLSRIAVGEEFHVLVYAKATAHNRRVGESYAGARLRDPLSGGVTAFQLSGLTELEPPTEFPPDLDIPLPECPVPPDQNYPIEGGVVSFQEDSYLLPESGLPRDTIHIGRSGGTEGVHIVTVEATGGAAVAGVHYEPLSYSVAFYDGDDSLRAIDLRPLRDYLASGNHDVTLSLTAERNCRPHRASGSTLVTLIDVDYVARRRRRRRWRRRCRYPQSYWRQGQRPCWQRPDSEERTHFLNLPVSANGPFEFNYDYPLNGAYDVRVATQPDNPLQACTVTHGTGTAAVSVTDILVQCTTPVATSGLDATFGTGGRATSTGGFGARVGATGDGKLVGASTASLLKYLPNGALDTTFGSAGQVSGVFGSTAFSGNEEIFDVVVQPDGKIVVAGMARLSGTSALAFDYAVARFNADGTRDPAFNNGNALRVDFAGSSDRATRVLLQPDGKIVLAGYATMAVTTTSSDMDFALVRLQADGSLDTSFGTGGKATANFAELDYAYAAALQSDGRVVIGGRISDNLSDEADVGVARFNADGTLDDSFGVAGKTRIDLSPNWDEVADLDVQTDGRIVAAVAASNVGDFEFGVLRLNTDGSRDASFGVDGWVTTDLGPSDDYPRALGLQADGKIIVTGTASNTTPTPTDFAVARYLGNGDLDPAFGTGGILQVDILGSRDDAAAMLIQTDGKIVAAGSALEGSFTKAALIRLHP